MMRQTEERRFQSSQQSSVRIVAGQTSSVTLQPVAQAKLHQLRVAATVHQPPSTYYTSPPPAIHVNGHRSSESERFSQSSSSEVKQAYSGHASQAYISQAHSGQAYSGNGQAYNGQTGSGQAYKSSQAYSGQAFSFRPSLTGEQSSIRLHDRSSIHSSPPVESPLPAHSTPDSFFDGAKFSRSARHHRKIAFRLLAEHYDVLSELPFPAKTLDLGCKSGEMSKVVTYLPNVSKVVALDPGSEMIAVAETFNADGRIEYQVGNPADVFQFVDKDEYSLVLMFDCDSVLRNPIQSLMMAYEALKPGGFLLGYTSAERDDKWEAIQADVSANPAWSHLSKRVEEAGVKYRREAPWALVSEPEDLVGRVLDKVGFAIHRCTLEDDAIILSREEALQTLEMEKGLAAIAGEEKASEFAAEVSGSFLGTFDNLRNGFLAKATPIVTFLAQKPL